MFQTDPILWVGISGLIKINGYNNLHVKHVNRTQKNRTKYLNHACNPQKPSNTVHRTQLSNDTDTLKETAVKIEKNNKPTRISVYLVIKWYRLTLEAGRLSDLIVNTRERERGFLVRPTACRPTRTELWGLRDSRRGGLTQFTQPLQCKHCRTQTYEGGK